MVSVEKNLQNLQYEMHCLKKAIVELRDACEVLDILAAWGDVVTHFRKASEFTLRIGRAQETTRGLASKLTKQRSTDKILNYMEFARNVEEHGDNEAFPESLLGSKTPTMVEVPFFGRFGPGVNVTLSDVSVNGVPFDGHLSWRGAKPEILGMQAARVVPPCFKLHPVSTKQGKVIPVPCEESQDEGKVHIYFAEHAVSWLEDAISALKIELD